MTLLTFVLLWSDYVCRDFLVILLAIGFRFFFFSFSFALLPFSHLLVSADLCSRLLDFAPLSLRLLILTNFIIGRLSFYMVFIFLGLASASPTSSPVPTSSERATSRLLTKSRFDFGQRRQIWTRSHQRPKLRVVIYVFYKKKNYSCLIFVNLGIWTGFVNVSGFCGPAIMVFVDLVWVGF